MQPLILPWLIIALLIAALILLFLNKWRFVALLLVFAIIVNWWSECFPFRLWPICEKTAPCSISVLTFNICSTKEKIGKKAEKLADLIRVDSPDIIFISEIRKHNKRLLDSLLAIDYPYTLNYRSHGLYCKHPLSERMTIEAGNVKDGGVIKCMVFKGTDTIIVYGCHLPSNNYSVDLKYITPDSIKDHSTLVQYARDINLAYNKRIRVSEYLVHDISQMNKPVIVLGDMNDVGGSKTIRIFESIGLKDAWWEGGFGYGATTHQPLPYRIDHILYSNELKLNNVKVVSSEGLSDHNAVFAEFSY